MDAASLNVPHLGRAHYIKQKISDWVVPCADYPSDSASPAVTNATAILWSYGYDISLLCRRITLNSDVTWTKSCAAVDAILSSSHRLDRIYVITMLVTLFIILGRLHDDSGIIAYCWVYAVCLIVHVLYSFSFCVLHHDYWRYCYRAQPQSHW